jgi:hypothetical protein
MLLIEDRNRQRLERLHQRMVNRQSPATDPQRVGVRRALLAPRALCLLWADGLREGEHVRYNKRALDWPNV